MLVFAMNQIALMIGNGSVEFLLVKLKLRVIKQGDILFKFKRE